jgi:hypothetical protein
VSSKLRDLNSTWPGIIQVHEIWGSPIYQDGIRASMGDLGFRGPARWRVNVQVYKIRGYPFSWTPDLGFPCPSGWAWSSECEKFLAPLSVEMEFMQVWEIRGSLSQQDGGRECRCARFGDPPGRQTWGSLVHPDKKGKCWGIRDPLDRSGKSA